MSFLMLLQIPLKYLQLFKNSPTIFSGTYKSFICCVNYMAESWNRLWKLPLRLRGRQGRCALVTPLICRVWSQISLLPMACCWAIFPPSQTLPIPIPDHTQHSTPEYNGSSIARIFQPWSWIGEWKQMTTAWDVTVGQPLTSYPQLLAAWCGLPSLDICLV